MAWTDLKAAVAAIIKTNGNNEITGALHQSVINNLIDNLGANASYKGIAIPTTAPGTPDGNLFYLANQKGTYSNFNGIVIDKNEFAILKYNNGAWSKETLFDFNFIEILTKNKWIDLNSTAIIPTMSAIRLSIFKAIKDIWFSSNIENLANLKISLLTFTKDYSGTSNDYKLTIQLSQNDVSIGQLVWSNILASDIDKDILLTKTQTFAGESITCNVVLNFVDADGAGIIWNDLDINKILIRPRSNGLHKSLIDSISNVQSAANNAQSKADENALLAPYINKNFISDFDAFKAMTADKIAAFKAIGDVWADGLIGSAYESYQFAIYYIGKNDPTYQDIFSLAWRENVGDSWNLSNININSGGYWTIGLNHKTFMWNDIEFNFLVDSEFLPSIYKYLTAVILNVDDYPKTDLGKNYLNARPDYDTRITDNENNIDLLLGSGEQSPNQSQEYLSDNPAKNAYYTGHTKATDIQEQQTAPTESTIKSLTTAIDVFTEEGTNYIIGDFKENLRDKLQAYEIADGSTIYPIYLKGKVYNSHDTESVTIGWGIRLKVDGNWYLPVSQQTVLPGETKSFELLINPTHTFDWSQLGTDIFGYWIKTISAATEADPAKIYIGDVDLYFFDPKKRELRPIIAPESIKDGIKESQLSTTLQSKINSTSKQILKAKKAIVLAGSSITWGDGFLDDRFAGKVDEHIKENKTDLFLSDTDAMVFSQTPTNFSNNGLYKSVGKKITGLNEKVTFAITGDELAICQAIQRTTDYGEMTVKADGVIIGKFTNHNDTLGNNAESFVGNGTDVKYLLEFPYTYNHILTVGGVSKNVVINTGGYGGTIPVGADAMIIRAFDANGDVKHMIWFAVAPANGAAIEISYDYGKVIFHEKSTVGQLNGDDATNESPYGFGTISFDPASPSATSSGMEFRSIDKKAFWIHKFTSIAEREIEIEITGGTNPYFILNFVTNRYFDFMNAGIGGWKLSLLLDNNGVNDFNNFFKDFIPDIIINESATNDDWNYGARRLNRTVTGVSEVDVKKLWTLELSRIEYQSGTGDYEVDFTTGLITSIDKFSLVSPQIVGSGVIPGDLVRIGNYYGDNKQIVVRLIDTVDTGTGTITWLQPLNPTEILNVESINELIGSEVSIRDLSNYKAEYVELIDKLQKVSPQTKILIAQPGLSDYYLRQLWGYEIIHRQLAAQFNNVDTIEITNWLYDFQQGIIDETNNETIVATGANEYSLTQTKHWQGFEVWVNGVNVYGKDCYILSGYGYGIDPALSGAEISITGNYDKSYTRQENMKLVFFKNVPNSGNITVKKANTVWSSDFTHTNETGGFVYGQIYCQKIAEYL